MTLEAGIPTTIRKRVTYFLGEASTTEVMIAPGEATHYGWFPLVEARRKVRYPARREMLDSAVARAECPGAPSVGDEFA
jgi:predicted NUDIX family NTP pyrophosphohydrolase